jgi:kumamolisin
LWAGLLARINQALGKNVGYLNPLLYTDPAESTFRDITAGSNGDYSAGSGWDACTGWGTPDGTRLLAALQT